MGVMLPRLLGKNTIEDDLRRIKALSAMEVPNPLMTYDVFPWTDRTYKIGNANLKYLEVHTTKLEIRDGYSPGGGTIEDATTSASPTVPRLRVQAAEPQSTWAGSQLQLRAIGFENDLADLCWIRIMSGAQVTSKMIGFLYGSETAPAYYFYSNKMNFSGYVDLGGGLNLSTGYYSTLLEDGCLMQGENDAPGSPTSDGVSKLWLSNGVGTGDAGDLMVKIREGGSTRTFTLASHSAGGGNNTISEYLYHAGDLDTYLRFQDDQVSLAAGAAVFLDFAEGSDDVLTLGTGSLTLAEMTEAGAGQHIVVWNSADADVDFRWDSAAGDAALFVEGSSGFIGIGTSDPDVELTISGGGWQAAKVKSTDGVAQIIIDSGSGSTDNPTLSWYRGGAWRWQGIVDSDDSNKLKFQWHTGAVWVDAITQTSDPYIGINESSPVGMCHINQDDSVAAVPVLHLEQDDVDQEFIRVTGRSALSLTHSLVNDDDVDTWTLVGGIKVNVQDESTRITSGPYYVPFYSITEGWQLVAMGAAELTAAGEQVTVINV